MGSDDFEYRLTILAEPNEDGSIPEQHRGSTRFFLPFDDDEDVLLATALEFIGVFNPDDYSIESTEDGGFLVRDSDAEPVMSLELLDDSAYADEEDYSPYVGFDGGSDESF